MNVMPQDMLKFLLNAKVPQWQAEGLVEDYTHYARVEASFVTNNINEVTGKAPRNFKDFTGIMLAIINQYRGERRCLFERITGMPPIGLPQN
jgi:hypothetical protein